MDQSSNSPPGIHEIRARLREWIIAAEEVPDPHEDLETITRAAAAMLTLGVPDAPSMDDVRDRISIEENILDLVKREVRTARRNLRRRADLLAAQAARVDKAIPSQEVEQHLTDREAKRWNEATENERAEARRRWHVLHALRDCDTTDELREAVEQYRSNHPDEALSVATYYRYEDALQDGGITGLLPDWGGRS